MLEWLLTTHRFPSLARLVHIITIRVMIVGYNIIHPKSLSFLHEWNDRFKFGSMSFAEELCNKTKKRYIQILELRISLTLVDDNIFYRKTRVYLILGPLPSILFYIISLKQGEHYICMIRNQYLVDEVVIPIVLFWMSICYI